MLQSYSVVGRPLPQKDGIERVTGRAKYFADIFLPDMLCCKILRSPHAQAKILSIDHTEAEALPGVELVMSRNNFPKLFDEMVHFVGDELGAVVAVDEETAEEALELIKVQYEPLPFVLDIKEAMKPDAPRVFPDRSNVRPGWGAGFKWYYFSDRDPKTGLWTRREESDVHGFGDVEQGFRESEVIVEDRGLSQGYSRVTIMEPRGCVADYKNGKLTVWTHSQGLHQARQEVAKTFNIPANQINIVSPYTGGSFGGKASNLNHIPIAAALNLERPVKLVCTREEELLGGWARGSLSNVKLGFQKDGRVTAMDVEHWVEVGPDGDCNPVRNVFRYTGAMLYARNCKHLRIKAGVVFTNRFRSKGWHGFGTPETGFMIETVMDEAAYVLGIDPVELRRINHFQPGDPIASARSVKVSAQISSCGLDECLTQGTEGIDWGNIWSHPQSKKDRVKEGCGMALSIHGAGDGLPSAATVKVMFDGTVLFECGIADIGQGQHTVQSQMVAEVLGVPYEHVRLICDDTDSTPYATVVGGSQGTWHQGKATYLAALDAKQQILEMAGRKLQVDPASLDIKEARVIRKDNPESAYKFSEIFGAYSMVIGTAQTTPDGLEEGVYPREQAAQFCRLAVDTETGLVSMLEYTPTQYVGRALNPKIVAGQINSGVYHGIESSFLAECIADPQTGRMLTYNWENYKPMTMLDFAIKPIIVEKEGDSSHPFGAIACGEGAINPVCAVCGNAIYNAIGVRIKTTPFTPDKILEALGKIQTGKKRK